MSDQDELLARPKRTDWFGGVLILGIFTLCTIVIVGLYNSDVNRSQGPVGVFQFGIQASTLDCDERTDCLPSMATTEDVENGYIRN